MKLSKNHRRMTGNVRLLVAAGAAISCLPTVKADTFTWANPQTGSWSTPSNWTGGIPPVSSNTTQLVFTPGTYNTNNDIGDLTVNSLSINNPTTDSTDLINVTGFNTLTFDGPTPTLYLTGGNANVSTNIASTAGMQITNSGAGGLILNGESFQGTTNITNSGPGSITLGDSYNFGPIYYGTNVTLNLANTGPGTLNIGNIGPSAGIVGSGVSGTVNITAGAVSFAGSTSGDLFGSSLILNVAAGASFNFANNPETFGGLTGAGNIILGSAGMSFTEPGDRTFTGGISGTGGVTQNVASVFTLGGTNNTYSGTTTVTGGGTIRAIGTDVFSPNSVVTVTNGLLDLNGFTQIVAGLAGGNNLGQPLALNSGTLTINPVANASYNFYSGITGGVNLAIGGPGTESLLGNNTYTGSTNVSAGSLRLNAVGLATSGITLAAGTTLYAVYNSNANWTTPISGTGAFVKEGSGTATFSTGTAYTPTTLTINAGTITLDQSSDNTSKLGSPALTLGGGSLSLIGNASQPSLQTFGNTTVGGTTGSTRAGSAEITVTSGAGQSATLALGTVARNIGTTLDFNTINPSGGNAIISASTGLPDGTVTAFSTFAQNDWATTSGGNVVPMNSYLGTFGAGVNTSLSGNASTGTVTTNSLRIAAPSTLSFTGSGTTSVLTLTTGGILVPASVSGAVNIGISGTGGKLNTSTGEIVVNDYGTGTLTMNSIIAGATSLTKSGPGTLVLAGASSYTGTTYIDGGTVQVSASNNLGATTTPIVINGGTLSIPVGTIGSINGSGGGVHPITVGPAGATFNFGAAVSFYGSGLTGTGTITKTGVGQWSVGTNASTFSGNVIVNQGITRYTSSQFKLVTGYTVNSGAQYMITDDAAATKPATFGFAAGAVMSLAGNGPSTSSATTPGAFVLTDQSYSGSLPGGAYEIFSNPIVLTADTTFGVYNATDNNATGTPGRISSLTLNGAISGPGNLTKVGSGILILANASDAYGGAAGTTSLVAGTIQSGIDNALATTATLQFGQTGSSTVGTFDTNGFNQTLSGLTVASGTGHQIINSSTVTGSTLTLNYNGTTPQSFTGQIGGGTVASPSNNNISLVKTGSGTVSLLGTTTYSGNVNVSSGALRVTGNAISRGYSVSDGATLIIANSDGTALPATTVSLGTSGITNLAFEFNGPQPASGALAVNATNGFTTNGTIDVAVSSVSGLPTGTYPLITYSGSIQGAGFSAFNPNVILPARVSGMLVNDTANDSIDLVISGVDFLKWSGNVNSDWDINTTANFKLNSNGASTTYQDLPAADSVVFDDSAANKTVNLTTKLSPAGVTVSSSSDYTFSGTGSIAGTTGLIKSGTGTLNVLTNNSYTGQTVINAGSVVIGNGGTAGSLGSGAVVNNAMLTFNRSDDLTFTPTITGTGSLTKMGANNLSLSGALNLGGNVAIAGGSLSVNNGGSIGGDVTGPGTLNIANGTLQIGNGGTTGTVGTNVTLASNGTLSFNRSDSISFANSLTGNGNLTIAGGSVKLLGSVNYTGITTIAANSTLEFGSDTDTTLTNNIAGTGTLIKSGAGQLTVLDADPNYTGNVIVNSGIFLLADRGTRGGLNSGSIVINSGGHFIFGQGGISGENPDLASNTLVTINTGGVFEIRVGEEWGGTSLQGGTFLITAPVGSTFSEPDNQEAFAGFDLQSGNVASNVSSGSAAFTSIVSATGITKSTASTVTFTGPITYNAATPIFINQGTLSFQAADIPTTGTAALTIGGATTSGTLQLSDGGAATISRPVILNTGGAVVDFLPGANGPTGSLTIAGQVSGASLTQTGTGKLTLNASNTYTGNTNIAGGTLALGPAGSIAASPVVSVGTNATFMLNAATNTSAAILTRTLNTVNVGVGGQVVVAPAAVHAARQVVVPASLSLSGATGNWTSKVDLSNNDMVLHNSAGLAVITDQVRQGYNATGAIWGGTGGITSSSAAGDTTHLTALGVIQNSVDGTSNGAPLYGTGTTLGLFDNQNPSSGDVLVKYTYYGDTNLDGVVDGGDYSRIDAGYLSHATGWFNGDFNYDGIVDGSDYTLIDNAFNTQGVTLAASVSPTAVVTDQIAGQGASSVPEPGSAVLIGVAAIGLLSRRRRFASC